MNQVRPIEDLFAELVELKTAAERNAYLDEVCGEDSDLRSRLEKLLAANEKAGSFLQDGQSSEATVDLELDARLVGSTIGPYKLREVIGEGGMGTVYVAEQEKPLRRKVALKVIKAGMDSKAVIARFEAERNALAMMNHPNIARVVDAGTTERGRPYFVMELVQGIPITEYCDHNNLSVRERLELFIQVCQAIQHAHQKGIIHRDIKPTNVLVTLHDGTPVSKVIDFGVAKAVNQRLTERTIYTRFAQIVGTPMYMSPEQAELSGLDIDTRTDIHSLGVLLYEMLTGTTPFERNRFFEAAHDEMRRIVREEEPPRPSTRISTLGQAATTVSAQRQTDVRGPARSLRGDIDILVMTALEKDRTRRYDTASAFAADVRRFLTSEPILARPPSLSYRLSKFARRNRVVVTTVLLVICSLIAGLVSTSSMAYIAWQQKEKLGATNRTLEIEYKRSEKARRQLAATTASLHKQLVDRAINASVNAELDSALTAIRHLESVDASPRLVRTLTAIAHAAAGNRYAAGLGT